MYGIVDILSKTKQNKNNKTKTSKEKHNQIALLLYLSFTIKYVFEGSKITFIDVFDVVSIILQTL